MVAPAMVEELLPMIGREREDAIVPLVRSAQRIDQPRHLRIDPPDPRVIKRNDLIAMPR